MANDEPSVSVYQGALYTIEERLETFKEAHWPYDSGTCTPVKIAEAGFYFCGSTSTPDWVRCIVCQHEMDGWEETDIPWEEHVRHKPDCLFIKKIKDPYNITVEEALELEKYAVKCRVKWEVEKLRQDSTWYCEELLATLTQAMESLPDD